MSERALRPCLGLNYFSVFGVYPVRFASGGWNLIQTTRLCAYERRGTQGFLEDLQASSEDLAVCIVLCDECRTLCGGYRQDRVGVPIAPLREDILLVV